MNKNKSILDSNPDELLLKSVLEELSSSSTNASNDEVSDNYESSFDGIFFYFLFLILNIYIHR